MSDNARMSLTDKVEAKVKPDSEKTTTEHFGDKLKGNVDNAAAHAQPESEKSYTQQVGDKVATGNTDNRSFVDKAKDTLHIGSQKST